MKYKDGDQVTIEIDAPIPGLADFYKKYRKDTVCTFRTSRNRFGKDSLRVGDRQVLLITDYDLRYLKIHRSRKILKQTMDLRGAIDAMIDGQRVIVDSGGEHVIFFENRKGFIALFEDGTQDPACGLLDTNNRYLVYTEPTIEYGGKTYIKAKFEEAIDKLEEVE